MRNNFFILVLYFCTNHVACQYPQKTEMKISDVKQETLINMDSNIILPNVIEKIHLSDEEWKQKLEDESYYVMRKQGTEQSFTGKYWDNHLPGVYLCKGCQLPLFHSDTKFESGTGWPSFTNSLSPHVITELKDVSYGMVRTEVVCARCKGHLGHVFTDGPQPTGLRYCMNSASLHFIPNAKIIKK